MANDEPYTWMDAADAATRMLRNDVPDAEIKELLPDEMQEDAWELARLRLKASERFEDPWSLFFDSDGLRYATPDTVAKARAQRMAKHGDTVIDVACGVGIQLAHLAQRFDEAIGIELDPDKVHLAQRNLEALDADAKIIQGDALDPELIEDLGPMDVVMCDPARAPTADERDFEGLSPDIRTVHDAWGEHANAVCYELPPMMTPKRVHPVLQGETEYTSLDHELNRLAVYGGNAKQAQEAALSLPQGERITDHDPATEPTHVDHPGRILHVVDRAVLQANLLDRLIHRTNAHGILTDENPRRTLLTSDDETSTAFTRDHEILDQHDWNLLGLHEKLKRLDAGKVTLRAPIDPDRYWDVRNALEDGLTGDEHVHLFRVHDQGIITQPL